MSIFIEKLIRQKTADKYIQVVTACIALALAPFTWLMSLFLLGIVHALSTICWAFVPGAPRLRGRKILEPVNIVVVILFAGCMIIGRYASGDQLAVIAIGGLLCIGPVLGISYFILTLKEISYYRKLLHADREA